MDRQTIEAAERVTAWSRARALSAVLSAPGMQEAADKADSEDAATSGASAFHFVSTPSSAAQDRQ